MAHPAQLIACHDCDLLQREIPLNPGCAASCSRCGAVLYRNATDSIDRALAYSLAAAVVFVIANLFPIFSIEVQGDRTSITLMGAVRSLWNQDMQTISLLVLLTTVLIPALELTSMTYLLLPLKFRRVPAGYTLLLRLMRMAEPWGMVEGFMLGVHARRACFAGEAHQLVQSHPRSLALVFRGPDPAAGCRGRIFQPS